MEPYTRYEHAGVIVEIVQDDEPGGYGPQDNDNAGTIYSWTRDFDGDERIAEPELTVPCTRCDGSGELEIHEPQPPDQPGVKPCPHCDSNGYVECDLPHYMAYYYEAVLTIPLHFADYGSSGDRIYVSDDANCAICFTQEDLDKEWHGSVDDATKYAEARIDELDQWMQGNVWGIVIREDTRLESTEDIDNSAGEVLESVWGFIGEPDAEYIVSEANSMAEACAEQVQAEKRERFEWECRDVVTV